MRHRFSPWIGPIVIALSALITFAACQNAGSRDGRPDPQPVQAPSAAEPNQNPAVTGVQGNDQAEVDVAGVHMTLKLADAEAIKAALLARLRQSQLPERDDLINATEHVPASINGGFVRIGIWILQAHGDRLALTYRMPAGPLGAQAFRAEVARAGETWIVKDVVSGQVRSRP